MKKLFLIVFLVLLCLPVTAISSQATRYVTDPGLPTDPSPADLVEDIPVDQDLLWTIGPDTETIDLYFADDENLVTNKDASGMVLEAVLVDTYDPGILDLDTDYFWRVVAHNSDKATTDGPVWSFRTTAEYSLFATKGTDEHINDVALTWLPDTMVSLFYKLSPQLAAAYQLLSGNVTSSTYHSDALIDGTDYYYKVSDAVQACQAGEVYAADDIVGNMHCIPPGTFAQGSPEDEPCRASDETQFNHTLTRTIVVMETEVTRQMWADLLAVQPSLPADPTDTNFGSGMNNPVQNLTWYEAVLFANLLSLQNGFEQCYFLDSDFTIPIDPTNYADGTYYCDFAASGYRLLSEGEWEYATRAGTTTPFSCPETNYSSATCDSASCSPGTLPVLEQYAYFCPSDTSSSRPVGGKLANPWNLYDMHGNVWEWVWDLMATYPGDTTDYTGADTGTCRVRRGGTHGDTALWCRSAVRACNTYTVRYSGTGFRLTRTISPSIVPLIDSITDLDSCAPSGVSIVFTEGAGASRHDLWLDETEVLTAISSPCSYDPLDTLDHDYVVRAQNGDLYFDSPVEVFSDIDQTTQPTIAGPIGNICPDETVTLSTDTGMADYQWYLESSPLSGETTDTLLVSVSGNYSVSFENGYGCVGTSAIHNVTITSCGLTAGELYSVDNIVGNMRSVPGDTFTQGSPTDEPCRITNETQFNHTLTRDIVVMETEVTRQMWADLLTAQPDLVADPSNTTISPDLNYPVQYMSWYETILFANLLSLQNGFERCYYKDAAFTNPVTVSNYSSGSFYCDFSATGYRLMTEGEWEFAARAGTTTPFCCEEPNYNDPNCNYCNAGMHPTLELYAVYCANDNYTTEPVGSKLANPWNLKDMHGNVTEKCWDRYNATYPGDTTDYTGPETGTDRIQRGGSYSSYAKNCRSAWRSSTSLTNRYNGVGFRLARTVNE
ncbi:SUMF1/EgtB/PvdO family nonheme iron enzyme [bacterium]|nr:SUMF1/EgtB/PvdO family nonheme iron enzyme [bacterium]